MSAAVCLVSFERFGSCVVAVSLLGLSLTAVLCFFMWRRMNRPEMKGGVENNTFRWYAYK